MTPSEGPTPSEASTNTGLDQPRQWTLTIPAPAKMINANDRLHWAQRAKLTKLWRQAAHIYARQAQLPKRLEQVQIDVEVVKPRAGRYDAMNFYPTAKAVVDGLVDYGLVVDDDNEHVAGPFLTAGGKGPAALVLFLTESPIVRHGGIVC